MIRLPSTSSLFPYTTLFRSSTVVGKHWTENGRIKRIGRAAVGGRVQEICRDLQGSTNLGVVTIRRVYRYRSEEHTSELQSRRDLVCRLLLEKKKKNIECNNR